MSLARRAIAAFAVVFCVSVAASGAVYVLAQRSSSALASYRARTAALDTAMWSLRSDFYNYDDQMNMYVAVLAGDAAHPRAGDTLAEDTYGQARDAFVSLHAQLAAARRLAGTATAPSARALVTALDALGTDITAYDTFAARSRTSAQAGDVALALRLTTRDNVDASNATMADLDTASTHARELVTTELDALDGRQREVRLLAVVSAAVVGLLVMALAWGMRVILLRPLASIRDRMLAIADGRADAGARLAMRGDDELAAVGRAFDSMLDSLAERDAELARATREREEQHARDFEKQMAAQDFVRRRAQEAVDATARSVLTELTRLAEHVEEVRRSADAIQAGVGTAEAVTRGAVEDARSADADMAALGSRMREVSGMASLIGGIAEQTKLLALNATIEAARAGRAGQGFSVVATEVKGLASAAAGSTEQITVTLGALEGDAGRVGHAIAAVGANIAGLDQATATLSEVATQQHGVVRLLDDALAAATGRIRDMTTLTEQLDRRAAARRERPGVVQVTAGGRTVTGDLVDVSVAGARCRLALPPTWTLGQLLQVRLETEAGEVRVDARVARLDGSSVGLEFIAVSEQVRATLESMVGVRG